jgi:hypothetical protein
MVEAIAGFRPARSHFMAERRKPSAESLTTP